MAEHHDSGVHAQLTLIAEANRLVASILGFRGGGSHPATIKAVRDFLIRFYGAGIPWVRMYKLFPDWQKLCGLLDQEWDRDAVLERAKVVFTLINPHGTTIRRLALGGGTWKGTGAETIGDEFVLTKLYYKRDGTNRPKEGFTVFEFHLKMDQKPRVAICVLHRKDYRHLIRDLKEYIHEGYFPGGNQANLQMVQPGPINLDPIVGGLMNGPDFDQTINQASENEANYGQLSSFFRSEIPQPVAQYGLPERVDHFSEHDQMLESIRYYQAPPGNSLMSRLSNDTTMSFGSGPSLPGNSSTWHMPGDPYYMSMIAGGYDHNSRGNPVMSLSNTQPINGNPYDMTTMFPEQDAPTNQVSMQNESFITSFGNSMGTQNWNAMTVDNEPLQLDSLPCGEHLVSTAQNYPQNGHFPFTTFSEHNSTFETIYNEPFLEHFPPTEYDSAATAHDYPRYGCHPFP